MVYMFIFAKVFSLDISLISDCSANPPHLVCLFTLVHLTLPLALVNNKFETERHLIAKLLQTKPLGSNQNFRSTGETDDLGNKI